MCLPQVGDGRRRSEVTKRGKGFGGGYPHPIREFEFCIWGGRVKAKRSVAYTGWIFMKYCFRIQKYVKLMKKSFHPGNIFLSSLIL